MTASESSPIPPGAETGTTAQAGSTPADSEGRQLLMRVLHMIVFVIALWVVAWAIGATVLLQLVLRFANGRPNPDLARFGANLGNYARQVIEYLTFASERMPFPFGEWPAHPPAGTRGDEGISGT